jgi:hypothetical protein
MREVQLMESSPGLYLDPHYFYSFELKIIEKDDDCPLKPGIKCTLRSKQCDPCICPKVQVGSSSYRGMHTITRIGRFNAKPEKSACPVPDLPNEHSGRGYPDRKW